MYALCTYYLHIPIFFTKIYILNVFSKVAGDCTLCTFFFYSFVFCTIVHVIWTNNFNGAWSYFNALLVVNMTSVVEI